MDGYDDTEFVKLRDRDNQCVKPSVKILVVQKLAQPLWEKYFRVSPVDANNLLKRQIS